jgi:hypothetical protein
MVDFGVNGVRTVNSERLQPGRINRARLPLGKAVEVAEDKHETSDQTGLAIVILAL